MLTHTQNAPYLPNGTSYELQTWYNDGARTPAPHTSAMISKVKVKVMRSHDLSDSCWTRTRESRRNTKISRNVPHDIRNTRNCAPVSRSKIKDQGHRLINADKKCTISFELKSLRTSNSVYGWTTKSRITDNRHDLQGQMSRS